jgi:arginase family enzyme
VLGQLRSALEVIGRHDAGKILTLGGECSVSVAPFAALATRYIDDLAIVWVDSHPDLGTPRSQYPGYHASATPLCRTVFDYRTTAERSKRRSGSEVEPTSETSLRQPS